VLSFRSFLEFLFLSPVRPPLVAAGAQKAGHPAEKGSLKSAGTMPKSFSRRNATLDRKARILAGFPIGTDAATGRKATNQKWL
jgi:hypothetical protein